MHYRMKDPETLSLCFSASHYRWRSPPPLKAPQCLNRRKKTPSRLITEES